MGQKQSSTKKEEEAKEEISGPVEKSTLGVGCYWGLEKFYRNHDFKNGKIVDVTVGFMGGTKKNPTYRQVCNGDTGHVEVGEVKFTGGGKMYQEMLRLFFSIHDPTTLNRQGNDRGTQYASVIFTHSDVQRKIAEATITDLQAAMDKKGHRFKGNKVVTQIREADTFYPASADHQRYLERNPNGYCNHRFYISTWPGEQAELPPDLMSAQTSA